MKIKISSFHIVCVILAEIIIVNMLLITVFIKHNALNKIPDKSKKVITHITVKRVVIPYVKKGETINSNKSTGIKGFLPVRNNVMRDKIIDLILGTDDINIFKVSYNNKSFLVIEKDDFVATAYDLSYQSCGKYPNDPGYGITFNGSKAVKGRTIAVDPSVIPLGSNVYVEFPDEYVKMDGWYVAEDTGSKVIGNTIDVFMGKSALQQAMQFGRRKVKLRIQLPINNFNK